MLMTPDSHPSILFCGPLSAKEKGTGTRFKFLIANEKARGKQTRKKETSKSGAKASQRGVG